MSLYLLRHARAGRRGAWKADDVLRPLTKVGRLQADAVVDLLGDAPISRIVSSPYLRCRQSVEALAAHLRLPVDLSDALAEGAPLHEVLRLVEKVADQNTVLCTHGDIVESLLGHLREEGVKVRRRNGAPPMEKGSVWELEAREGSIVKATYHKPPPPSGK